MSSLGCGTIMYPERKGQSLGKIDPAVAILDGLGLLLFLVPGVIAFAVDFSNGTIYLPAGNGSAGLETDVDHMTAVYVGRENLTQKNWPRWKHRNICGVARRSAAAPHSPECRSYDRTKVW